MADRRIGREDGKGPQPMQGVRRRPEFRNVAGDDISADNARDAALMGGDVRGDLRGRPASDPPGATYVNTRPRADTDGDTAREPRGTAAHEETDRTDRTPRRETRAWEDRQFSEDRDLTDDERVAMVRQGYFQVALPDLPSKPGLHRMWLTTTNPRDPIAARQRMGYRLLRVEDLGPGWEQQKATSGEYAGAVMINEMIAAEISETLYQRYMQELHHNMPRETERGIYGRLEAHNDALKAKGSRLLTDEGGEENAFQTFGQFVPPPRKFE